MTLLADLVATSSAVAATRARTAKVAALADLLRTLHVEEVVPAVAMLTGTPRQGRIGVGWRRLYDLEVAAAGAPSLTLGEVDAAIDALAACAGAGSNTERNRLLTGLLQRATEAEQSFVRRLLTGELRQGALEGVMTDAIARAADVGVAPVRRAAMLGGDLATTALLALAEGEPGLAKVGLEVGRPVLPMLAASSPDVAAAVAEVGLASVEWKLDGARVQVHRDGDEVRLFTRNLNEVTDRLPAIVAAVRAMPATRLVLDGEAMGFDEAERPGTPAGGSSWWARRSRASPMPCSSGRPSSCSPARSARTGTSCSCGPSSWWRSPSTGCSARPGTTAASPCASPG